MTISYTLDVSQTSYRSLFSLLFRWRGSLWKAVLSQLLLWTFFFLLINAIYQFLLTEYQQEKFEAITKYLNTNLETHIPLTFMLGFFVTFVVNRWVSILNSLGYIDNAAMFFATLIKGNDTETRMLRRTLVRYMVLNQALVLRDISMQVRKRFPTLDTLVTTGILTSEELDDLNNIDDMYSRYWAPIQWCYLLIYDSKLQGKISSDHLLEKLLHEVQIFRNGLFSLLKYDWVPIPLLYPQVIFFAVRLYFIICLFSRQHIHKKTSQKTEVDMFLPIVTMVQFVIYVGWMKVAEALLNPLGEDDDDFECNYLIDKNLITGLTLVDQGNKKCPDLTKDIFWNAKDISPLYSLDAAKRTVHPLVGSASQVNLVKKHEKIIMLPHKSKLSKLNEKEQESNIKIVDVANHNETHKKLSKVRKQINANDALEKIRQRHKKGDLSLNEDCFLSSVNKNDINSTKSFNSDNHITHIIPINRIDTKN